MPRRIPPRRSTRRQEHERLHPSAIVEPRTCRREAQADDPRPLSSGFVETRHPRADGPSAVLALYQCHSGYRLRQRSFFGKAGRRRERENNDPTEPFGWRMARGGGLAVTFPTTANALRGTAGTYAARIARQVTTAASCLRESPRVLQMRDLRSWDGFRLPPRKTRQRLCQRPTAHADRTVVPADTGIHRPIDAHPRCVHTS